MSSNSNPVYPPPAPYSPLRSNELPEYPIKGPFGGIQSELPSLLIEQFGFRDALNILFRLGAAYMAPGYVALTDTGVAEPFWALPAFFNANGAKIQTGLTTTFLLQWNPIPQTWTKITGAAVHNLPLRIAPWDIINYKLCYGGDTGVRIWDGIGAVVGTAGYQCRAMAEVGNHLLIGYTTEAAVDYPQRVRWCADGDPTDWASFTAGVTDLLVSLGPIRGIIKLYQSGYLFHQYGLTQAQLTGIGTRPFYFSPLSSRSKGLLYPYTLSANGEAVACYVGKDNVYLFDGSSSQPIGDQRLDGRTRLGAKSRIFADLLSVSDVNKPFGYITTNMGGNIFEAYWLFIPGSSIWIFNFNENSWTRITLDKTPQIAADFYRGGGLSIAQLIGPILAQNWTFAGMAASIPFDGLGIAFTDNTIGYADLSVPNPGAWSITSGPQTFEDSRHEHTVSKFRIVYEDVGTTTLTLVVTNEAGQSVTRSFSIGTGKGVAVTRIIEAPMSGRYISWVLSGTAGKASCISEITPIYTVNGEVRGG